MILVQRKFLFDISSEIISKALSEEPFVTLVEHSKLCDSSVLCLFSQKNKKKIRKIFSTSILITKVAVTVQTSMSCK